GEPHGVSVECRRPSMASAHPLNKLVGCVLRRWLRELWQAVKMDTSEFKIIQQIFNDAVSCDSEARARFVEKACEGDENRRLEVEQLLAAHDSAHSWVDGQVAQSIIRATSVTLKP